MTTTTRRLRACVVGLLVIGWSTALGASGASATAETEHHCVVPGGVDLNELFSVSEQIVTGTSPSCGEVGAGERFRPSVLPWFLNHGFQVVPEGFVAAGPTPLDDFLAKFEAVRYVIDPGTNRERTAVFPNDGTVWTGSYHGVPLVNPLTLGAVGPLPVGDHVIETYWVFSGMHCDGFGDDTGPGGNCFPAGETRLLTMVFEVVPGHFSSSGSPT